MVTATDTFAAAAVVPAAALVAAGLSVWGLFLLRRGPTNLGGTTLLAPWAWSVAAVLAIGGVEIALPIIAADIEWADSLRFVAASLSLCPGMAQLGAKRPQDKAWQLIVLSLVAVLTLPAAEGWLRGRPQLDMHPVRSWFLLVLIVAGVVNNLPTRYGRAALTFGLAQLALMWPQLPWGQRAGLQPTPLLGLGLIDVALLIVVRSRPNSAAWSSPVRTVSAEPFASFHSLWRDFRDGFGAVWSLRVLERINATAGQQGWKAKLDWEGFVALPDGPDSAHSIATTADPRLTGSPVHAALSESEPGRRALSRSSIEAVIRGVLWRFVSDEWIAQRLTAAHTTNAIPAQGGPE